MWQLDNVNAGQIHTVVNAINANQVSGISLIAKDANVMVMRTFANRKQGCVSIVGTILKGIIAIDVLMDIMEIQDTVWIFHVGLVHVQVLLARIILMRIVVSWMLRLGTLFANVKKDMQVSHFFFQQLSNLFSLFFKYWFQW